MSIPFKRHILENGLRLIVHEDHTTPLAACNLVYHVGSRDENPNLTGIAHLFEHFMFCGSKNIPSYDEPLQKVGAINNAYTSQDHTHYYVILPANNLETALWLESDRMLDLAFQPAAFEIQKKVVIEEFKETTLNRPFGDLWSSFNDFVFEEYPYKWMPIGKEVAHIECIDLPLMKDFYVQYYCPNNAVLVIGGDVYFEEVVKMVEKWFGDIPRGAETAKDFPAEPVQTAAKFSCLERLAPYGMLLKGWKMPPRLHPDFCAYDLLSDLLGTGNSSYLYQKLVIEEKVFSDISASVTGTEGPGIFSIVARPLDTISIENANEKLNDFLYHQFSFDERLPHDLQKVKNRNETVLLTNEMKMDSRTSILAVSETIGQIEDFENDHEDYQKVTEGQVERIYRETIQDQKDNTLFYIPMK